MTKKTENSDTNQKLAPLAERMRPVSLDEFVGQEHILGRGSPLEQAIESDTIVSMILWGPAGTGKTSLASVIAKSSGAEFRSFSAVLGGVAEVRRIVAEARVLLDKSGKRTILFVDEIHRFNKAQQDAFLPHVEAGTVILIGATTENPSFEINTPLLSRCRVFKLEALNADAIKCILRRAVKNKERGLGDLNALIDDEVFDYLVNYSGGDARTALGALEFAVMSGRLTASGGRVVDIKIAELAMQKKAVAYDKNGEEHYNIISAFIKSMRGSDVSAALYWMARMLEGGEAPRYIFRRMIRFAAEDIGLADPEALKLAVAARDAFEMVGLPEGELFLVEVAIYLAAAPKSNALYAAWNEVKAEVKNGIAEGVPLHLRNAPTKLMKEFGYGKNYKYDQASPDKVSGQTFLPPSLLGRVYYEPGEFGFEREMKKRIDYWERLRKKARG